MSFVVMDPDPMVRVQVAIEDIRAGRMVILVDDEDRENEGDLTMAAAAVTPEAINFMAVHGRGLICLTLTAERVSRLQLSMMSPDNQSPYHTAFTVSIEAREGVTTGISAADRAHTIRTAVDPAKGAHDLVSPGHIFPLRARDGGVLVRTGQTEGSVDLARLAGLPGAGVICEIMNDDGTMARLSDLEGYAERHKLHICTVADLIRWRMRTETLVEPVLETTIRVPDMGEFDARIFQAGTDGSLHLALSKGKLDDGEPVLTRVQVSDPISDVFGTLDSDSGAQLYAALAQISAKERGVLLYLHLAGRTDTDAVLKRIRKNLSIDTEETEEVPLDAVANKKDSPVLREMGTGAQILVSMGVSRLELMTNNPRKIVGLEGFGIKVVNCHPLVIPGEDDRAGFAQARKAQLAELLRAATVPQG